MEPSEDEALGGGAGTAGDPPGMLAGMAVGGLSVYEPSFPARVAAFLRFSPVIEAVQSARRRGWPEGGYDVVTLALAAIDLVVARQGFEEEATRGDVVSALTSLASSACPDRPAAEHADVGGFVVDYLLNRQGYQARFRYVTSDYSSQEHGHYRRDVPFALLEQRDDPTRDENVLRATADAINALIGGLDFDVEDEQVATEIILQRQLERNAFDSAVRSAERARLLSVSLAEDLDRVVKQTRRDLRAVEAEWATDVPDRLAAAREHIGDRLKTERYLLGKVREALASGDEKILAPGRRIARLLEECQSRHEALHQRVIVARGVFLDEQERQAFRPPAPLTLPDPHQQVLLPALELDEATATVLTGRFLTDMLGPRVPHLPRLYRLVNDLWAHRATPAADGSGDEQPELADPVPPLLRPEIIDVAIRAVARVGLPARLSALLAACHDDPQAPYPQARDLGAEVINLSVLWAFSPEAADGGDAAADDLMAQVLGRRAAVGSDGTPLRLPGWDGDDVIVALDTDALATASPVPATSRLPLVRAYLEP